MLLFRVDEISGELSFENSWGDERGLRGGIFPISSLKTLSPGPDNHTIKLDDIVWTGRSDAA